MHTYFSTVFMRSCHFTRKVKHRHVMAFLLSVFPVTATCLLFFGLSEICLTRMCFCCFFPFFSFFPCSITSNVQGQTSAFVCSGCCTLPHPTHYPVASENLYLGFWEAGGTWDLGGFTEVAELQYSGFVSSSSLW